MPWVRIDEEFPHHPKVAPVGPLGIAMQVAALCYCNRYLTDGFVPAAMAPMLLPLEGIGRQNGAGQYELVSWQEIVQGLVRTGLWEPVEGGWRIHDFHDYQPTREDVEARRVADHENKVAAGKARAAGAKRDRGRFVTSQVNTSTTSSPPAVHPAEAPAAHQQPTSPVPEGNPSLLTVRDLFTRVGTMPVDEPVDNKQREGKARKPRTTRHPSDEFVISRARQIQAESGPEAAKAYLRKVGENYGQASRADQLARLEEIIAQDAAAEAGQP